MTQAYLASLIGSWELAAIPHSGCRRFADVLQAGGFRGDVTTRPMLCRLADADLDDVGSGQVLADVDPDRIAELNGVSAALIRGVPGARAYATAGFESGLIVLPIGSEPMSPSSRPGRRHGDVGWLSWLPDMLCATPATADSSPRACRQGRWPSRSTHESASGR
jgi:hypothetical protein